MVKELMGLNAAHVLDKSFLYAVLKSLWKYVENNFMEGIILAIYHWLCF
jgi:hypothetical protein